MSADKDQHDHMVKIMIIGESGSGKSCLLQRFNKNEFLVNHLTTIAIDFKVKIVEINGVKLKMQIWDTAGQERFNTLTAGFYKAAHGIIVMYSIVDVKSFENVEKWMTQIQNNAPASVKVVLVGNKSDLSSDRVVETETGQALADKHHITFFETSAFNGENVNAVFHTLGEKILNDLGITEDTVKLAAPKSKACCS